MAIEMDFWRQLDVFAPDSFQKPVYILGAGATGSYIAETLCKMGVRDIHLFDFDTVKKHNLPNQYFGLEDIGKKKAKVMAEAMKRTCGTDIKTYLTRASGATPLSGIVFLLVDKMDVRKEIWQGAIKLNPNIDLMIETRMGIGGGRIYAIKPFDPRDIDEWEKTLYSDDRAERNPCTSQSISPTVKVISGMAVLKLVKLHNGLDYQKEVILSLYPSLYVMTRTW